MGIVYSSVHGGCPQIGDAGVGRSMEGHSMKTKSSFKDGDRGPRPTHPCPFPVTEGSTHAHTSLRLSAQLQAAPCPLTTRSWGPGKPVRTKTSIVPFHGKISVPSHFSIELGNACLGQYFVLLPCSLSRLRKCRFEFHKDTSVL